MMIKKVSLSLLTGMFILASCHQENFDDRCAREAQEFTKKQCPQILLADGVRLDSMVYDRNTKTMKYYNSLFGSLDTEETQKVANGKFRDEMVTNVKNAIDMKQYKDKGLAFNYIYISSKTGKKLVDIHITPEDYR